MFPLSLPPDGNRPVSCPHGKEHAHVIHELSTHFQQIHSPLSVADWQLGLATRDRVIQFPPEMAEN